MLCCSTMLTLTVKGSQSSSRVFARCMYLIPNSMLNGEEMPDNLRTLVFMLDSNISDYIETKARGRSDLFERKKDAIANSMIALIEARFVEPERAKAEFDNWMIEAQQPDDSNLGYNFGYYTIQNIDEHISKTR